MDKVKEVRFWGDLELYIATVVQNGKEKGLTKQRMKEWLEKSVRICQQDLKERKMEKEEKEECKGALESCLYSLNLLAQMSDIDFLETVKLYEKQEVAYDS